MTGNKFQNISAQEFLAELKERAENFTHDEFVILIRLLSKYQQEFLKTIQAINPQVHQ
jgi:hypothetical protein